MKKIVYLFGITALFMACTPKNADEAKTGEAQNVAESTGAEYGINTETSQIMWRGTKPGGEHYGTVSTTDGTVMVDDGTITGGKFVIDLNSIVNDDLSGDMNARLVGHLKSEDFFYTEQYPEAVFEIVSISDYSGEAPAEGIAPTHEITGNLTMRGETKSISFPAMVKIEDDKIIAKTNEFSIDRTKWGVNFKSKTVFAEFKDDFINDMINLKFDVEFDKM
ncbi:MAG: YceI family protein [Bacteroidales bacterium]